MNLKSLRIYVGLACLALATLIGHAQSVVIGLPSGSSDYNALSNKPKLSTGQMLYNQSGDTIASIETACSSLCTYIVTTPQTITLAANHTLSSNVQLDFRAGGLWTVNGAFTLTIPGNVTGTLNQHFAGSSTVAFGLLQQYAPVEWFGAVGDGSTVDYTAIQHCLNAISAGQCVLQAKTYSIGANTLSINKSSVGITGTTHAAIAASLFTSPPASFLLETGASQDVIDVAGSSTSATIFGNRFTNFTIERSLAPSGTAAGLSLSYTYSAVIDHVVSMDSVNNFYIHASGSGGQGYIDNSEAEWGYNGVTISSGTLRGFYIDSTDGKQSPSLRMHDDNAANGTSGPTVSGYVLNGSAVNDFMGWNLETSGANIGISITGSGSISNGSQDIHLYGPILDLCSTACIEINSVVNSQSSSVDIDGGFIFSGSAGIFIGSSNNVTVRGVQTGSSAGTSAVATSSSTNVAIVGNNFINQTGDGVVIIGGSNIAVTGNTITGNSVARGLVRLTSSPAHVTITGNTFGGTGNAGVVVEAGSSDVEGMETNTYASTLTNKFTSAIPFLIPPTGSETVASSATPTFSNTTLSSINTLTANVTSFTLAAGVDGQQKMLTFCQNGTGSFTVAAPANVHGFFTVGATASKCSTQGFTYSAGQTAWLANSLGVTNQ